MQVTDFHSLVDRVLTELRTGLSSRLTYHSVKHTIDVMEQAEAIAHREDSLSAADLFLLKVAALYHDTGFLQTYKGHEELSCMKASKELLLHDFSQKDIDRICGMIMATKIPQRPTNLLEQIIADADLDYLGRTDFAAISNQLRNEFLLYGIVESDASFDELQIRFFESHEYFTASSRNLRAPLKQKHYETLMNQYRSSRL